MNNFRLNRFGKTLRWYASVNFRRLMSWNLGFLVGVFLAEMMIFISYTGLASPSIAYIGLTSPSINSSASMGSFFIVIGVLASFSSIMSEVNKKRERTAFLMLPASNLEKFLSLVCYVTVVWVACLVLAFVVGDSLRMAVRALFFGDEWVSAVPLWCSLLWHGLEPFGPAQTVFAALMLVWIHSLYILGGTWLRKYSFIVSSLVLVAVPFIVQYVCVPRGEHLNLFVTQLDDEGYIVTGYVNPLVYVLDVLSVVFAVFNYWASYRIFKGFQLITNKWTNYDILKR